MAYVKTRESTFVVTPTSQTYDAKRLFHSGLYSIYYNFKCSRKPSKFLPTVYVIHEKLAWSVLSGPMGTLISDTGVWKSSFYVVSVKKENKVQEIRHGRTACVLTVVRKIVTSLRKR